MPARRQVAGYTVTGGYFSAAARNLCPEDSFTLGSVDVILSSVTGSVSPRKGMVCDTFESAPGTPGERLTDAAIAPTTGTSTLRGRHRLQRTVTRPEFSASPTTRRYQLFTDETNHLGTLWYDPATDDTKAIIAGDAVSTTATATVARSTYLDYHYLFPNAGRGRLITPTEKWGAANGARNTISANGWTLLPKFSDPNAEDGVPMKWNGQEFFQGDTTKISQAAQTPRTMPVGHVPPVSPLTVTFTAGAGTWATDLLAPDPDQYVYYTYLYQWEDGSISPPVQWRPTGTATVLPNGWCRFAITLESSYADVTNIMPGPPGVKARWLLRTFVAEDPDILTLGLCAVIENNYETSYRDYFGGDDAVSDISDLLTLDAMWMPEARCVWSFDQRIACGHTRPNRAALLISCLNNQVASTARVNINPQEARCRTAPAENEGACDYAMYVEVLAGTSIQFHLWDGARAWGGAANTLRRVDILSLTATPVLTLQQVVDEINNRSANGHWGTALGTAYWTNTTLDATTKTWPVPANGQPQFYAQLAPGADPGLSAKDYLSDTGSPLDWGDNFERVDGGGSVLTSSGLMRVYGNCLPALFVLNVNWSKQQKRQPHSVFFTGGGPGVAPNAMNNWYAENERTTLDEQGDIVGGAALLSGCLVLSTRGASVIRNIRDTKTGADQDYRLEPLAGAPGCIAPDSIAECNGVVLYLSELGLMACDGERFECLSTRVYNEATKTGEWAYEIAACKAASEADTDDTYFGCSVIGQRVWVWYRTDATTRRTMMLDFSASRATSGMAQFLDDSGKAFGWSAPLTIPLTCLNLYHDGTDEKLYGVYEGGSGRIDQFDVGVSDYGPDGGGSYEYSQFISDVYFKMDTLGVDRKKSLREVVVKYKNAEAATNSALTVYRNAARTLSTGRSLPVTGTAPEKILRYSPTLAGQSPADVVEFFLRIVGVDAERPELWSVAGIVDVLEPNP